MKVLYCYRYGILGGVCTQLINRMRVLESDGSLEAHLLFSRDYGISKTLHGYSHLYFEPNAAKVRDLAAKNGFDATAVIDTPEYLSALNGLPGVPLIVEVHTTTQRGLQYLEDRQWQPAGYIVPSEYSRNMLRERFRVGEDQPVHVVPNSLDLCLFPRVEVTPPGSRPVFAWVGKLDDHKNWRGFLDVAARIVDRGVDAEFWLIGGETAPAARQDELIDHIEVLELHSRCRWFPRIEYRAMHKALAGVRASGGAIIVTSLAESFGMSVLEALMCGCPVVASRVGALPELAPGRSYLRFYAFGRTDEAADVATALVEPQEARRVREELDTERQWLRDTYSCESVAARYVAALRELISRCPAEACAT